MRKASFIFMIIVYLYGCSGTTEHDAAMKHKANPPLMAFADSVYNFGIIEGGSKASHTFTFINKGNQPVIISDVQSFCGCTIPDWTHKPVKNNRKGHITIHYDTHSLGVFDKSIKIYSNATNSPVSLTIRGEVRKPHQQKK